MLIIWSSDKASTLSKLIDPILKNTQIKYSPLQIEDKLPTTNAGDVVFAMGAKAQEILMAHSLIPKNRTIQSLRLPHKIELPNGAFIVLGYSAAMMDIDYEKHVFNVIDLTTCLRAVLTGSFKPVLGKYKYVDDFSEIVEYINNTYEKTKIPVKVTVDLETVGLDYVDTRKWIVSVQVTHKAGEAHLLHYSNQSDQYAALQQDTIARETLNYILTSPKVSVGGANFKFDQLWLWFKAGLECTNYKFDTYLVGSLIDENRGNSLNLHTKWYVPLLGGYDDYLNKKYNKARMDLIPKEDLLDYAGGDTDACYQVRDKMTEELTKDNKLSSFYIKLLHPAAKAFTDVEKHGLCLDIPYYLALEDEIETEITRLQKEALKVIGGALCAKHADNLKLSRAALIKDFMFTPQGLNLKPKMFTEKTKEPSTSVDHILMFGDHPQAKEFMNLYKPWLSATKTLSTYVCKRDEDGNVIGGFLSHMRDDSRFHATYFLYNGGGDDGGTNTGRVSARDPAIQTVPKHTMWAKKLRQAFIAPEGMVILSNDYSQGELKIAACLANEETMIAAYRDGVDLHAVTASRLAGYEWAEFMALKETNPDLYDSIRQLGKAGNFGLIYGMGANGFQEYASLSYGVDMSMQEAEKNRDNFFALYTGLPKWHTDYKMFAKNWGFVRSPIGRVRHLPLISSLNNEMRSKAERQSVNSPVQATLSDFSLWATAIIHQNGWYKESPVVGMVHDQLISYVPENWEKYAKRNKEVMENLPIHELGWKPQLQFTVDTEVGINLGSLKKQKL